MLKLSFSTVTFDKFDDNRFASTFKWQPGTGIDYVEFNCWHPGDLTPSNIKYLKQQCAETGLIPSAVYGVHFGGDDARQTSMDVCHKLRMIDAACELGCSRVCATGAGFGQLGGIQEIITVLNEVMPYAEDRGVLMCLENHAHNNLDTVERYDAIFSAVPSPNLGMCVDTGHFDASGISLDEICDHYSDKINHIHIKEAAEFGSSKFVPFGQGVTDNNRIIERMLEKNYNGFVSVEYVALDMNAVEDERHLPFRLFGKYQTKE